MNANDEQAMTESRGLLLFRLGQRRFALPAEAVVEIAAPQTVTPLPFTPDWVDGLTSVGGRILPQVRLAALLGEGSAHQGGELIIINAGRAHCALLVDEVLARIDTATEALRDFLPDGDSHGGGYVSGELQYQDRIVLLLDVSRLGELFLATPPAEGEPGLLGNIEDTARTDQEEALSCLVFRIGEERYALPLNEVSELGEAPACTPIPGAPAFIAGIGPLREESLLLLTLGALLGLDHSGQGHIVLVVERGGQRLGLLIDSVEGIETFAETQVHPLGEYSGDVAAVLHNAQGLVFGLLASERLLNPQRLSQISAYMPAQRRASRQQERTLLQHLEVLIAQESFAIPLETVQRIVPWHPAEAVAQGDRAITGLVNIDGSIIPVLDNARLRRHAATNAPEAWIILGTAANPWALAVDQARAIVNIPEDGIEQIGGGHGLVRAVATVDERLLSLLAPDPLMAADAP